MSEIEEVRQKIIAVDKDFGERGFAYFDSLGLENIHAVSQHFGSPFPGVRGSRALDAALRSEGFFKASYEIALDWPGYCSSPIFGISLGGDNRESCTSMRGYISLSRGLHLPNGHEIRHIRDAKLQNFLLGELISAYNALFNGNGK